MARFYQVFERLPDETRGRRKGRTVLENEAIASACRDWLIAQTAGEVTPLKFQLAVNSTILPSAGIILSKPLSLRTTRRWLIRLGWRVTILRKGVYMDGHERADVVEY